MKGGNSVTDRLNSLVDRPDVLLAILAAVTFSLRFPALGDWNLEIDDQWYSLVGHRLLSGQLLYVDIFDRKGPALYLLFTALAIPGKSVLPYQILAGACATWASYLCARIAMDRSNVLAGLASALLMTGLVFAHGGANAQTPIFYNPLVLIGASAVVSRIDLLSKGRIDRRLVLGFLATGLAIAFKLSVVFEGIFFGLFASFLMWKSSNSRARVLRNVATLAAAGAAPMLVATLFYVAIGHFDEFWQAIVRSNFDRTYFTPADRLKRVEIFVTMIGLPLALFVGSVALQVINREWDREARFLAGWAAVSILAILIFPAFYSHYALTTIAPLCIGIAPILKRSRAALLVALAFVPLAVAKSGEFAPSTRERSRHASAELVKYVDTELGNGKLVVWGSPSYLHVMVGSPPLSFLAFPPHLYHQLEAGASGRDEVMEVRRMLAQRPDVVVVQENLAKPQNRATQALVAEYLATCRKARKFVLFDHFGDQHQTVYSRCSGTVRQRRIIGS
ncbi:hypothetical protein [Qipengyuania sp. RANM35]|uniref:hypothetical protein n=1 Tax=Qipengyuania sp. RANM35 TaxID=3068635 RepID=UPI0034DB221B